MDQAPPVQERGVRFSDLPEVERGSSLRAEWWLAWGHLRSKKDEAFLSIVSILSIIGVTAGVALLNWVISVMTGFEIDLRDKILGANAHVVVFHYSGNIAEPSAVADRVAAEVEGVDAAAPFVYSEMMIRSPWSSTGVVLKGIDPERTGAVTHVLDDLTEGYDPEHGHVIEYASGAERAAFFASMDEPFPAIDLENRAVPVEEERALPGLLIGDELRDSLQVRVGDKLQLINPLGGGTGPMGMPTPSIRSVRVAGVFHSGMYEYDTKWSYVPNDVAQDFLDIGPTATGIEVKVDDIDDVEHIAADIDELLGYPYFTKHWKNMNAKLFAALELEKWVMGLLLNMIVVNAGLLIITTLFMLVITKGREIAILKAMGATSASVLRVFVMEGAVIGGIGTVLGTVLGLAGCVFLDHYEYPLETDVYHLSTLPVVIDPVTVVIIAISAFTICFLCTIYPAWRAARLDPVEALRYE